MEEIKNHTIGAKGNTPVTKGAKTNKLSYEELERTAQQLSEQARAMYKKLEEANMNNAFSRLNFLFKILESQKAFSLEIISKTTKEIELIMFGTEEELKEANNE